MTENNILKELYNRKKIRERKRLELEKERLELLIKQQDLIQELSYGKNDSSFFGRVIKRDGLVL